MKYEANDNLQKKRMRIGKLQVLRKVQKHVLLPGPSLLPQSQYMTNMANLTSTNGVGSYA